MTAWRTLRRDGINRYPKAFRMTLAEHDETPLQQDAQNLSLGGRFLAYRQGAAIGSIGIYQHPEDNMRHRAVIFAMYVMPTAQNAGVANHLMDAATTYAGEAGVWQIELVVNEENTPAIALYRKQGFTQYGRLPNALIGPDGPEHDLLMLRILPHPS